MKILLLKFGRSSQDELRVAASFSYLLKCFVLVDLKIGELTHQDIGQMDGYVRMYEEQHRIEGDNPTIGLNYSVNCNGSEP
jgi:hypothetical protein